MLQNLSKYKQQLAESTSKIQEQALSNPKIAIQNENLKKEFLNQQTQISFQISSSLLEINANNQQSDKFKTKLIEKINVLNEFNHPLILQYLGIAVGKIKNVQKQTKIDVPQSKSQVKSTNIKQSTNLIQLNKNPFQQSQKKKQQQALNHKVEAIELNKCFYLLQGKKQEAQQNQLTITIMTTPDLQKINLLKYRSQPKTKEQFIERLSFVIKIVQSVEFMHERQFSFFPYNFEQVIYQKNKQVKLATHTFCHYRQTTIEQIDEIRLKQTTKLKKIALANRSLKFVAPEFLCKDISISDIRKNDVWKIGIFIFTILTGLQFSAQLLRLQSIDNIKDYCAIPEQKLVGIKKYVKLIDINQIKKTIKNNPNERMNLSDLLKVLKNIQNYLSQHFSIDKVKQSQKSYIQQQSKLKLKFNIQIKQNQELMTPQNKKKIAEYFKNNQNRIVKNIEVIYRASHLNFSSRCFYQAVFEKTSLIIVIQEKKEKKKIIFYSQIAFDLTKCNGIFGGFIKDAKKLSFLYSPQQNQFHRLKNPQRAIGVSHILGPIIGDGDIVISDRALFNTCRYPNSYESTSGKIKKLFKSDRLEIEEYDVYQVSF